MDFLDPKKQLRHRIILLIGYALIGIAITIGTLVLVYQAYGFGLGKNGTVIQNGLLFFSSQPNPADIYVNGTKKSVRTNTRLSLPEGIYKIDLKRAGYHTWHRTIDLQGGSVEHFDYPFLIPTKLSTKNLPAYVAAPALATQSPDRQWLLVSQPDAVLRFTLYDLKNPDKEPVALAIPENVLSKPAAAESWQAASEWAGDNQRVVLQHVYDGKTEYILFDRTNPEQSVNLSETLKSGAAILTLKDKKYDQYYLQNVAEQSLRTVSLKAPEAQPLLSRVLAYRSYGDNIMLYVTDNGAPAGKVLVKLLSGDRTFTIRTLPAGSGYLLDITKYDGTFYAAVGATTADKIYIYKDPEGQLVKPANPVAVPSQVLHVPQPNYLGFSKNAQFIVAENGQRFGVYDIENQTGYNYTSTAPLDAPQAHASWMDGHRLSYVSGGKLLIFDYDNTNAHSLMPAASGYLPFFTPNYKFVRTFAPAASGAQMNLTQTSLLAEADQ